MSSQFGPLLRGLRLQAGLTQEQLAERAGLGVRTVQRLETGKPRDARLGTVRLVAHGLADAMGRDRDDVWQELLAAYHDKAVAVEVSSSVSHEDAPKTRGPMTERIPMPVGTGGRSIGGMLAEVADVLAHDVRRRWIREEEQRRIHDPFPLPVRWRSAAAELLDHWDNISGAPPGAVTVPLSLDGGLADIADVYRRVPSGRLVVLGGAGSGKSVLMMRFVLDFLGRRCGADPVPVVFSIGSWDPTTTALREWLVERLLRDHPNLTARAPGRRSTMAAALVDAGWILPVLDGFDEIAAGLHRAAMHELNTVSLPLLLTSRTEQFADAAKADLLRKAAGIELTDLTTADLVHYLPRAARPTGQGTRPERTSTVWDPVLDELCDRPDSPSSVQLAAVLRTPLMVMLARTLYSDTPGQDPAVLLDTVRFPAPHSLEEHLLAGFVPTVYRQRPPVRSDAASAHPHRTWDSHHAQQYLGHLARHLTQPDQRDHQDLAWWQLSGLLSLRSRILAIVLACTVVSLLSVGPVFELSPYKQGSLYESLLCGLTVGPIVGLTFGLAYGIAVTVGNIAFEPSRVRLQLPRRGRWKGGVPARRVRTASCAGLLVGAIVGLAYGPAVRLLGLVVAKDPRAPIGVTEAMLIYSLHDGFVFAMATGLALGLMAALETPVDPGAAAAPMELLAINRTTIIRQALLVAPVVAIAIAVIQRVLGSVLPGWLLESPSLWQGLFLGTDCALIATLSYILAFTSWGQWLLFTRIWLPLTGRLPWATMAFLDDAYHRGVLRQVGAVYQFRHARLQHHLSHAPHGMEQSTMAATPRQR
ncbi:helix-turn-helix domain-containing protein [Kitasatospora cystarginea]|uniref:helix-turn-helix domain-containing protein n=1 Tax=Kitasatospora cystarginea TaxID=58350 RepID=UPI0031E38388